jgi:hypothetical protein
MFPNLSDMPSLGLAKQKIGSVWICVPDPKLFQDWINDGLANATYRFLCNQQSASACVEYDGKSTEVQKCGFGKLNCYTGKKEKRLPSLSFFNFLLAGQTGPAAWQCFSPWSRYCISAFLTDGILTCLCLSRQG